MNSPIYLYQAAEPTADKWAPLGNNYMKKLTVNQMSYKSVTHFIYSNLVGVDTPGGKKIREESGTAEVPAAANAILKEKEEEILKVAVANAIKFMIQKPEFLERLKSLKDKNILYQSENDILGIGKNGGGANLYGRALMSIGGQIEKESPMEDQNRELYELYAIISHLKDLISSGKDDLSRFVDKTPMEIKKMIGDPPPVPPVDFQLFGALFENKSLKDLDILEIVYYNPKSLSRVLRNRWAERYNEIIVEELKSGIMRSYLTYLISSNYPEVRNVDLAISQNLDPLTDLEIKDLEDRLYHLYILDAFPDILATRLKKSSRRGIEIEEYKEPLGYDIAFDMKEGNQQKENFLLSTRGDLLSPTYTTITYIDNFPYPSISHYLLFTLILNLPSEVGMFNTARALILKNPMGDQTAPSNYKDLDILSNEYTQLMNRQYNLVKLKLLEIALNEKFNFLEKQTLGKLLLETGEGVLIYNDPDDDFLGTGGNAGGLNMTGKMLMKIRNGMQTGGAPEPVIPLRERRKDLKRYPAIYPKQTLAVYLKNNDFLIEWVNIRLQDICRVIGVVHSYAEQMRERSIFIDKNMSDFVINTLYNTCLPPLGEEVADIPLDFEDQIRQYLPDSIMFGGAAIENIWIYIDTLVQNLNRYTLQSYGKVEKDTLGRSIDTILKSVIEGAGEQSCRGPYLDLDQYNYKYKNCVFRAIITVSMKIKNFVEKNYKLPSIDLDKTLIDTSLKIILPMRGAAERYIPVELSREDEKILQYLPSFDPREVLESLNGIYNMYVDIGPDESYHEIKLIRLLFFLNEKPYLVQ